MWGGRFREKPSALLRALNDSFEFDRQLLAHDIEGSIAWANELGAAGVLAESEVQDLVCALEEIASSAKSAESPAAGGAAPLDRNDIPSAVAPLAAKQDADNVAALAPGQDAGNVAPLPRDRTPPHVAPLPPGEGGAKRRVRAVPEAATPEDVHSFVEALLREKLGPLAGKLHTGRSRNDQVATDLRLWTRSAFDDAIALTSALARTLAHRALEEAATPMPGYTHLKQAEPVTFGHWCMAYVAMLERDLSRLRDARDRANECPLGSAALAGTPLPIDRERLAHALGFDRATANSLDAVSDRDFAAEYLFAVTMLLSHLSRLAEDLIFFTSDEVAYAELPDALATGSSRMPQKKNPDVLELTRGHAARSIGELTGFLALLKGLPLAYNKDLQLDKEPLFRTRTLLAVLVPALTALIEALKIDRQRMREAAGSPLLLATDAADELARQGVPFREAHEIVGRDAAHSRNSVEEVLAKKNVTGGTAPSRVQEAAEQALARHS